MSGIDVADWKTAVNVFDLDPLSFVEVANVLSGAAILIQVDGWMQNGLFSGLRGPRKRCARGAMMDAAGVFDREHLVRPEGFRTTRNYRLFQTAEDALRFWLADQGIVEDDDLIPDWNDASERTQDQILAALQGCSEFVRSGEDRDDAEAES